MRNPHKRFRPSELTIVFAVQREAIDAWVRSLSRQFDIEAIGDIHVSKRSDGTLAVVDGQHRILALRQLGYDDLGVWCHVYEDKTPEEECDLFLKLNNRRNVTAADKFRIGVGAGLEDCVAINSLLRERGLAVTGEAQRIGASPISCAATLRSYWSKAQRERTGPQALAGALDVALAAWGPEGDSLHQSIIGGLSELFLDNAWIDSKHLADKLAKAGSPGRLIGKAKARYEYERSSLSRCMAKVIADIYNSRRGKKDRLEA